MNFRATQVISRRYALCFIIILISSYIRQMCRTPRRAFLLLMISPLAANRMNCRRWIDHRLDPAFPFAVTAAFFRLSCFQCQKSENRTKDSFADVVPVSMTVCGASEICIALSMAIGGQGVLSESILCPLPWRGPASAMTTTPSLPESPRRSRRILRTGDWALFLEKWITDSLSVGRKDANLEWYHARGLMPFMFECTACRFSVELRIENIGLMKWAGYVKYYEYILIYLWKPAPRLVPIICMIEFVISIVLYLQYSFCYINHWRTQWLLCCFSISFPNSATEVHQTACRWCGRHEVIA